MNFLLAVLSYTFLIASFFYAYNTEILKTILCVVVYLMLASFRRYNCLVTRIVELEKERRGILK